MRGIADLLSQIALEAQDELPAQTGLAVGTLTPLLGDSLVRLARLVETPRDIPVVVPLIQRELLYRLLTGDQGARLRHLMAADSQTRHIVRVLDWLRENYTNAIKIDDLAQMAAMSVSTFHYHFKAITAMSPLQYQKQLRLQEARRLLL